MKNWTIKLWDGYTNKEFTRYGTYEQVKNSCSGFPAGYIWSIS